MEILQNIFHFIRHARNFFLTLIFNKYQIYSFLLDELSTGSGNASPRSRRLKHPHGAITPNGNGSRNHSPRPSTKDSVEARLKPGINDGLKRKC